MSTVYKSDFHAWAKEQAELARLRSANALDWDNVAEELDALSRSEYRELRSRYIVLIAHLLKWLAQPERQSRSWRATIDEQRREIAQHLLDNPSLKPRLQEAFTEAYPIALARAAAETDLEYAAFPAAPPFTPEQARDEGFWPEAEH
jgi:hypothetical protein